MKSESITHVPVGYLKMRPYVPERIIKSGRVSLKILQQENVLSLSGMHGVWIIRLRMRP